MRRKVKSTPHTVSAKKIRDYIDGFKVFVQPNPKSPYLRCMYCCDSVLLLAKKSVLRNHVLSVTHEHNAKKSRRQQSVPSLLAAQSSRIDSCVVILRALLRAGVSYRKASTLFTPDVISACQFISNLPSRASLQDIARDKLLPKERVFVHEFVGDDPFSIIADESSLPHSREFVIGLVIATWRGEKVMCLHRLEDGEAADSMTMSQAIMDEVRSSNFKYEKLTAVVSDNAAVMTKAMIYLKTHIPGVRHVACLSHCLNLFIHGFCDQFSLANDLLAAIKLYVSAGFDVRRRRSLLSQKFSSSFVSAMNVRLQRWTSWLTALEKVQKLYDELKTFFMSNKGAQSKEITSLMDMPAVKAEIDLVSSMLCSLLPVILASQSSDELGPSHWSKVKSVVTLLKNVKKAEDVDSITDTSSWSRLSADEISALKSKTVLGVQKAMEQWVKRLDHVGEELLSQWVLRPKFAKDLKLPATPSTKLLRVTISSEIQDEWTRYLKKVKKLDSSPSTSAIWEEWRVTFPELFNVVKRVLAVPVTGAGVERAFAAMRLVVNDHRVRLGPDLAQLEVMCRFNHRESMRSTNADEGVALPDSSSSEMELDVASSHNTSEDEGM